MSKRQRRPFGVGFVKNLTAGDYNPTERAGRVLGNLLRRTWIGSGKARACCGHYGDPGC